MFEDLRARISESIRGPARIALRTVWTPTRSEYLLAAIEAVTEPARLLHSMLGHDAVELPSGFPDLVATNFPALYQIDEAAQRLLWGFVRSARPKKILETGVADGASTRVILDALEANGDGRLYSFDVSPAAGDLAKKSGGVGRWNFTVLPARGRAGAQRRSISALRPIDAFLHDSDHRYAWQSFEYREAWSALAPGGWLLSDDIDLSYAFLDFARSQDLRPWVLVGPRKLFGALRKPS